ncbi:MAG: hypothetical protein P1U32_00095 [Legionellaceae bacterium]|nr:hypothetical protein [Legionellaceae bacterium]
MTHEKTEVTNTQKNSETLKKSPLQSRTNLQHLFRPATAGAEITMRHVRTTQKSENRPFFNELANFNRENLTPSPSKGSEGPTI